MATTMELTARANALKEELKAFLEEEGWSTILDQMIKAFELIFDEDLFAKPRSVEEKQIRKVLKPIC